MSTDDMKVIVEYFDDKFAAMLENVEVMVDKKILPVAEDIQELKADMKVVKAAVTATNEDVQDLQKRVTALETA